jgi:nitroreductase
MELYEAIKARKSIRGYKPDSVSKETIQKILDIAVQSPSAMNTQPWQFYILGGDLLKTIGKENIEMLSAGTPPATEVNFTENHKGDYKKRQVDLAIQLFQLMDIAKDDQTKRFEWMQRGFRYFDAPAAIVLTYDTIMDPAALAYFDLGLIAHAICLAAVEEGLGTCIHGQGAMYPQVIRKHVEIPDTKKIFNCISIGYPDWDFPANKVESTREPAENMSSWFGF